MAEIFAQYIGTLEGGQKTKSTIKEEKRYAAWRTARLAELRLTNLTAAQYRPPT